jgi:hypothetical protein
MRFSWVFIPATLLIVLVVSLSAVSQLPLAANLQATGNFAQGGLSWESPARLRQVLRAKPGTLIFREDGLTFREEKGPNLHWPFWQIKTFDLLNPRSLVITDYENRSWHRHGDRKFHFDLAAPMPPTVAAAFASRVGKPARNGDPNPSAPAFATLPVRHPTFWGGTNGTLRFGENGIEYLTTTGKGGRSWRWADIETLTLPDPYHLNIVGYRESFAFELKRPMSGETFDRLWQLAYARNLTGLNLDEGARP